MKSKGFIRWIVLGSLLACLVAAPAHADLYWESIQKSEGIPGTPDGTQIVKNYMTAHATRYESRDTVTIVDLNQMKMFSLDPKAKTYQEIDLAQMGQMPGMEGEAGKQFMGMMKGLMGSVKVTPTKETRTISGYACTKYNVSFMGTRSENWITRDIEGYDEMMRYGKRFSEVMSKNPMMKQMNVAAMIKDLKGFPVETVVHMMAGKMTTTLQKFEQKKLTPNLFKVPNDYKKVEQ
ncbi:MAG: DUF4412 domain-containing protein [Deltaproteobacteria bacterium]|nr:DUF4412 domain-containing protein [Deltaproteobacteria bacterium]